MSESKLNRIVWLALAASCLWLGLQARHATAQVTYFDRPPTADELRRALLGQRTTPTAPLGATETGPASAGAVPIAAPADGLDNQGRRTRGIQWIGNEAKVGAVTRPASLSTSSGIREASGAAVAGNAVVGVTQPQPVTRIDVSGVADDSGSSAALPINFRLGSSRVEVDSLPYVAAVAAVLRADPRLSLVIEGHTDISGDSGRNLVLSWDRALGVMRALVEDYGIDASRLQPIGKGSADPLPGRSARDGANRRVQLRVATAG